MSDSRTDRELLEAAARVEPIKVVQVVKVYPTACWIEDTIFGERRVMLQHEGCEPFAYASFGYDYRYTSNAGTWSAAHECAKALGFEEPIEHRPGSFPRIRWWHEAVWRVISFYRTCRRAIVRAAASSIGKGVGG